MAAIAAFNAGLAKVRARPRASDRAARVARRARAPELRRRPSSSTRSLARIG
jgi:hypothetical protein